MIGQKTSTGSFDKVEYPDISIDKIKDLLGFLQNNLSCAINVKKKSEDNITTHVCEYLNQRSRELDMFFIFHNQPSDSDELHTVDMAVGLRGYIGLRIFAIEAKRLYKNAGKDYVCGKTGGIERFKKNLHGNGMPMSAMLGYVQDHDFCYWHQRINTWIDDEVSKKYAEIYWKANEKLKKLEFLDKNKKVTECISVHPRKDNADITLIHFWLDFKKP